MIDNEADSVVHLCVICLKETKESLVEKPNSDSYEKVLEFLEERVKYGSFKYSAAWEQLESTTAEELANDNASWHRRCYQDLTHIGKVQRARESFEKKQENGPEAKRRKSAFTRSQTAPYDKNVCFFCGEDSRFRGDVLHLVTTSSVGIAIQKAVRTKGDEGLLTKLSTAVDANDSHAIDVKYHKNCYTANVTNVLRRPNNAGGADNAEIAARVEFLDVTRKTLEGTETLVTIADLENLYIKLLHENNVDNPSCSRKTLKQLLISHIPEIEFHRPKRRNEPERVTIKAVRDESILSKEDISPKDINMTTIYEAAAMLRKSINRCEKWTFNGRLEDIEPKHVSSELYTFFRWIIQGTDVSLSGKIHFCYYMSAMNSSVSEWKITVYHYFYISIRFKKNKKCISVW